MVDHPVSGRAMEWALETAMAKRWTGPHRDVLLVLAYHANKKTGEAWPSVATLMDETGHGRRAVYYALASYRGLIDYVTRPGFPTVWRFPAQARGAYPQGVHGGAPLPGGGCTGVHKGVHGGAIAPLIGTSNEPRTRERATHVDE